MQTSAKYYGETCRSSVAVKAVFSGAKTPQKRSGGRRGAQPSWSVRQLRAGLFRSRRDRGGRGGCGGCDGWRCGGVRAAKMGKVHPLYLRAEVSRLVVDELQRSRKTFNAVKTPESCAELFVHFARGTAAVRRTAVSLGPAGAPPRSACHPAELEGTRCRSQPHPEPPLGCLPLIPRAVCPVLRTV